jgi:transcription factor SPN1
LLDHKMAETAEKLNKLKELAERKRKEQEDAEDEERRAKMPRPTIDFGEDSDGEPGPAEPIPAAEGGLELPTSRPTIEDMFGEDDEDEDDLAPNAADNAFIDDTELAPDLRVDFTDEGPEGGNPEDAIFDEAEEAAEDEIDRLLSKRRRHDDGGDEAANRAKVEGLLTQMEVAVEEDFKAYEARKPAVHKLRMLSRVEEILGIKKLHGRLLDEGFLGVLKAWIDLMPDGTLPNSKVRSAVLKMLCRLPIDCSYEDRREQLKKSGLGKMVMFYCKLPEETPDNRRIAQELVERWSRPILAPRGPAVDEAEMDKILEARRQRERIGASAAGEEEGADGTVPRPGDPNYRRHARIPQAAALDYVKRPENKTVMVDKRGGAKAAEHKLTKKLKGMGKKASMRAANVSVEGRNVSFAQP